MIKKNIYLKKKKKKKKNFYLKKKKKKKKKIKIYSIFENNFYLFIYLFFIQKTYYNYIY